MKAFYYKYKGSAKLHLSKQTNKYICFRSRNTKLGWNVRCMPSDSPLCSRLCPPCFLFIPQRAFLSYVVCTDDNGFPRILSFHISTILEVSPLAILLEAAGSLISHHKSLIHLSGQKLALQGVWTNYPTRDIVSYLHAFYSSPQWMW